MSDFRAGRVHLANNANTLVMEDGAVFERRGVDVTAALDAALAGGVVVRIADFLFTERATAGVYTATLPLPAGTTVLDLWAYMLGFWAADVARLDTHDTQYGNSAYFGALSLLMSAAYWPGNPYNPTDFNQSSPPWATMNNGPASGGYGQLGLTPGLTLIAGGLVPAGPGVRYPLADTLTITVSTTVAVPPVVPTGSTLVRVLYLPPGAATGAGFTAA